MKIQGDLRFRLNGKVQNVSQKRLKFLVGQRRADEETVVGGFNLNNKSQSDSLTGLKS